MKHIMKCLNCNLYTMQEICPKCGNPTIRAIPPKYSPNDKYAEYRRKAKEEERKKEGLI